MKFLLCGLLGIHRAPPCLNPRRSVAFECLRCRAIVFNAAEIRRRARR